MNASSTPKACLCGCTRMTKGGDFVTGHDAKFKSMLINGVIEGKTVQAERVYTPAEAEAVIVERQWISYLEKRRTQPVRAPRASKEQTSSKFTESPEARILLYNAMHAAYDRLRELGIHAGPDKVVITRENCTTLAKATDEELLSLSRSAINVAV